MDGEQASVPEPAVAQHLGECAGCREWQARAEVVSRQARVAPAPALDALADGVLAAIADRALPSRREWPLVRIGLCLVALAQLAITIPVLLLGHDREAPLHVSHEMGSWDAALALGLLFAARRPSRAEGMTALVGVGAVLLCITAVIDLAAGRTSISDEAPHLLCVAGWLLLYRLSVLHSRRSPGASPIALEPSQPEALPATAGIVSSARGEAADRWTPDASAAADYDANLTA